MVGLFVCQKGGVCFGWLFHETIGGGRMIYLPLTRQQAKLLLSLLDALCLVFKSDTPLLLTGIRNRLYELMYPDQ